MKKLLVLVLVLGMASLVQAAPVMSFDLVPTPPATMDCPGFNPDLPLNPSEWVEIDVIYNGDMPLASSGMLYLTIEGNGEWCGADADAYLPVPGVPIEEAWTVHPNFTQAAAIPGFNMMTKIDSRTIEIGGYTAPYSFVQIMPGDILFDHLNIHCTGIGDVVVTLTPSIEPNPVGVPVYWDGAVTTEDLGALGSSITIHQIPEPMTMSLLGLGGLGLLRRRRA